MRTTELFIALLFAGATPLACSDSSSGTDVSSESDTGLPDSGVIRTDAAAPADAANPDASQLDATSRDAAAPDATTPDSGDAGTPMDATIPDTGVLPPFTITSAAYTNGSMIPTRHTCRGVNIQPQFTWTNVPPGTMSFALVLIDDSIDFVHWIAYNIPASTMMLPEGASNNHQLPPGSMEARAYCNLVYCGPCPSPPAHTYTFRLYAIDQATVPFTATGTIRNAQITAAFGSHMLGRANLSGTFP